MHLVRNGVGVWLDAPDLRSDGYAEQLGAWLRDSDLILLLLTPELFTSSFLREAWEIARVCPTPKVVLRFNNADLPEPAQGTIVECREESEAPRLVLDFIRSQKRMRLFVSYSHKDMRSMRELVAMLKHSLNRVWVDGSGLKHGEDFPERIRKEIEECDYFLLVWSRNGRESRWVEQEWNYGYKIGKRILPLLLDSTPLPMVLEKIHAFASLKDERFREFFSISTTASAPSARTIGHWWRRIVGICRGQSAPRD